MEKFLLTEIQKNRKHWQGSNLILQNFTFTTLKVIDDYIHILEKSAIIPTIEHLKILIRPSTSAIFVHTKEIYFFFNENRNTMKSYSKHFWNISWSCANLNFLLLFSTTIFYYTSFYHYSKWYPINLKQVLPSKQQLIMQYC